MHVQTVWRGGDGMTRILAIDLGAESGRGVIGTLSDDRKLSLNVIHRFPNGPVKIGETLYWNTTGLIQEIRNAIRLAADDGGFASVGIDTWGVDFALLGKGGTLVGSPVHYRDSRTDGQVAKVFAKVPQDEIYAVTGIQTMPINTLFQLASLAENHPEQLTATARLLFIPDFLHGLLTGGEASEFTIASTSQMLDITTGTWAVDVLERLGRWEFWGGNYVPTKTTESIETVDNVVAAVSMLSARKTGALILISRETPLEDVASTGTRLDANVNSALLNTIFEHGTPLHDGAVIIHRGRILAAGCTLQISDAPNIGANVHMRHRAAIGASEQSDAIVVVVSEETGTISIAESGRLVRGLSQDALRVRLMERLGVQRTPMRKPWSRGSKGTAR